MADIDKQRTIRPWLVVLSIFVFVGAIYSGFWLVLAMSSREQVVKWIREQSVHGLTVHYDELVASGYPFAIRLVLANPRLNVSNTVLPWDWQGANLKVTIQLWDRNSFRIKASGQQVLVFGKDKRVQKYTGNMKQALGRFVLSEGKIKKVRINLLGVQLTKYDPGTATIKIPRAELSLNRLKKNQGDYLAGSWGLSGSTEDLTLPWFEGSPLGDKLGLNFNARLIGNIKNGQLIKSLESWRDHGGTIELEKLKIEHGPLKIHTEGTLALDGKLQPIGALTAQLKGFYETIDALKKLGVVKARNAITAKMFMGVLSRTPTGGGPPVLNLAITAQNQNLYVGPVRLLQLPEVNWHQGLNPFL